jgi:ABC-type lipoprotein export system ATPase subunit
VFQLVHLVPYLNVWQNVLLAGGDRARAAHDRARAVELLERIGLADRVDHLPEELSAGERQRAATARALFCEPALILADEPTGNLDPENAATVLDLLSDFHRRGGTVLLATHGPLEEGRADRTVRLEGGHLVGPAGA